MSLSADAIDPQAPLKAVARTLFLTAVSAADPAQALDRRLRTDPMPQPDPGGRLIVVAVGKAAPAMMQAALPHIPKDCQTLVVTHHENTTPLSGVRVLHAGHPVPDSAGLAAAQAVKALLSQAGAQDRVVALVSGGGSALLPAPRAGLSLGDKARVNQLLLSGGLDITQMNLVRQHLSELKGGGFLRLAAPAPVTGYILSDVIGDDLRVIASGPTVGPVGTAAQAVALLRDRDLWEAMPQVAKDILQGAPPASPLPEAVNHLIGSNRQSLDAMQAAVQQAGWQTAIVSDHLTGDVQAAAEQVLSSLRTVERPTALLFGGETTVVLRGTGRGGRNQELALRLALAAPGITADWVFLSGGTDGRDGPTDAAGGLVDAGTTARIRAAGGDPLALLNNNDSYKALDLAQDLLITEATGTNVADVQVLLIRP